MKERIKMTAWEQLMYYKKFCYKNNLKENLYSSLEKFLKEVLNK